VRIVAATANEALEARARLDALLARNRAAAPPTEPPAIDDVRAIRSVYRTARPAREIHDRQKREPVPEPVPVAALPSELPTEEELATAARVLRALAARADAIVSRDASPSLKAIRADANRLVDRIRTAAGARKEAKRREISRADRAARRAHDRALAAAAAIRMTDRIASRETLALAPAPAPSTPSTSAPSTPRILKRSRRCYICKQRYRELDAFYDQLCTACAEKSWAHRHATADLRGRRALLTGGRVKIGHEAALSLLRAGAELVVTTRFPVDAARRFAAAADFDRFRDRLRIVGLDLRHLDAVERFAAQLADELPHLDILVNNAAQTVRRPAGWFDALVSRELAGRAALPPAIAAVVDGRSPHAPLPSRLLAAATVAADSARAAILTQAELHPDDRALGAELFRAPDGGLVDPRLRNSWALSLTEIEPIELVETALVGALAPFLLVRRLLPAMLRSPFADRYVVNVTAMEGKFDYANKRPTHPHTNMTKAALNMLTRTVGPDLVERGVYMTSVDTGWVTNEQPAPVAERMRDDFGFATPLDERDGAARVLHPIFAGVSGEARLAGCLLKDYRVVTW
jgi:NAD(P)-dependent dehydrogenase (short-subunit alcohol dehydrogenase family)